MGKTGSRLVLRMVAKMTWIRLDESEISAREEDRITVYLIRLRMVRVNSDLGCSCIDRI